MTSQSHVTLSMTSAIDAPLALSYRLAIGHEPRNRLVSETISIKVADKQTDTMRHISR